MQFSAALKLYKELKVSNTNYDASLITHSYDNYINKTYFQSKLLRVIVCTYTQNNEM